MKRIGTVASLVVAAINTVPLLVTVAPLSLVEASFARTRAGPRFTLRAISIPTTLRDRGQLQDKHSSVVSTPTLLLKQQQQQQVKQQKLYVATRNNDDDDYKQDDENAAAWEYLTPTQVKTLRKEASKLRARNQLATHILLDGDENNDTTCSNSSDDSDSHSNNEQDVARIANLLQHQELVQVRGISRNNRKLVKTQAEQLALQLEEQLMTMSLSSFEDADTNDTYDDALVVVRPVFLLDCNKGHAAIYYSPLTTMPHDNNNSIVERKRLQTSFQHNAWTKKPRPKRDSRGQIIKGEYE